MRNVIVTGGSRGLGLGIARRLAECGYRAIVIARTEGDELVKAQQEANAAQPGSLSFVRCDLAEIEGIRSTELNRRFVKLFRICIV